MPRPLSPSTWHVRLDVLTVDIPCFVKFLKDECFSDVSSFFHLEATVGDGLDEFTFVNIDMDESHNSQNVEPSRGIRSNFFATFIGGLFSKNGLVAVFVSGNAITRPIFLLLENAMNC